IRVLDQASDRKNLSCDRCQEIILRVGVEKHDISVGCPGCLVPGLLRKRVIGHSTRKIILGNHKGRVVKGQNDSTEYIPPGVAQNTEQGAMEGPIISKLLRSAGTGIRRACFQL